MRPLSLSLLCFPLCLSSFLSISVLICVFVSVSSQWSVIPARIQRRRASLSSPLWYTPSPCCLSFSLCLCLTRSLIAQTRAGRYRIGVTGYCCDPTKFSVKAERYTSVGPEPIPLNQDPLNYLWIALAVVGSLLVLFMGCACKRLYHVRSFSVCLPCLCVYAHLCVCVLIQARYLVSPPRGYIPPGAQHAPNGDDAAHAHANGNGNANAANGNAALSTDSEHASLTAAHSHSHSVTLEMHSLPVQVGPHIAVSDANGNGSGSGSSSNDNSPPSSARPSITMTTPLLTPGEPADSVGDSSSDSVPASASGSSLSAAAAPTPTLRPGSAPKSQSQLQSQGLLDASGALV